MPPAPVISHRLKALAWSASERRRARSAGPLGHPILAALFLGALFLGALFLAALFLGALFLAALP